MLYLNRKIGESIIINDSTEVQVVDVKGKTVKLGFVFPASTTVLRKEIHEKIQAENREAARPHALNEALRRLLRQSPQRGHDGDGDENA